MPEQSQPQGEIPLSKVHPYIGQVAKHWGFRLAMGVLSAFFATVSPRSAPNRMPVYCSSGDYMGSNG